MTFFRTRLSAIIVWAMIPLAAYAGMPSTACVCANGHVEFICAGASRVAKPHGHEHAAECASDCRGSTDCCGSFGAATADAEHDANCCAGGFCCHGPQPDHDGVCSKPCCQPILSAPSMAPQIDSVPGDQAAAVFAVVNRGDARVHAVFAAEVAELNTGPPLDRVIVFRSLLI